MITTYYKDPLGNIQNFISYDMKSAEESIRYLINTGYSISEVEHTNTKCRVCGCDDDHACKGGCYWIEPDLCSQCYEKQNTYSVKLRVVKMIGDVIQDGFYDIDVLADEIPTEEIATGFIYGYAAGKGYEDYCEYESDDNEVNEAIGISIWKPDEVIVEYFFTKDEV